MLNIQSILMRDRQIDTENVTHLDDSGRTIRQNFYNALQKLHGLRE